MNDLEKLKIRLGKLSQFEETLRPEERRTFDGYTGTSPMASVIYEEQVRIEREIAKLRMDEFLDMDEIFEKEVL